jgi:SsrA-binding protein
LNKTYLWHNKKITFDYEIISEEEAGIVLIGKDIKWIISGKFNLDQAFIFIKDYECFCYNFLIDGKAVKRKLLLHRKQIFQLKLKIQREKLVIIPNKLFFNARHKLKLNLIIGKRKKKYDKRLSEKQRDFKNLKSKLVDY